MNLLVCGAGGLLGSAIAAHFGQGVSLKTAGRAVLQGADDGAIDRLIETAAPSLVINCAADIDAERAEQDDSIAVMANVDLPRRLANACAARGALLVHFSSTGCYGAWKDGPYVESDPLCPTTRHHKTKAKGEAAVRDSGCDHLIARTGWLYGGIAGQRRNFVWNRIQEARGKAHMVSDGYQHGCPTLVDDVARQIAVALDAGLRGTINLVAHGSATRAQYVARIVAAARIACTVEAGPAYPRLAPVSHNETAINSRLLAADLDTMPSWDEAVDRYVTALLEGVNGAAAENGQ